MLRSHRRVLNISPSSSRISRRITLSRVVVLPAKSMRRTKNCLPSSAVRVRSILSPPGNSKDGSGTKSMNPNSPYSLRICSRPLRSLAVEKTSPSAIWNSPLVSDSGERKNFTPI